VATTIEVTGGGSFRGSKSSLTDFGVQESITPLNAAQPGGGVGTISFGATENVDSLFLLDNGVELNDGARGQVLGTVRSLSSTDFGLQVTADSILSLLKATRTAEASRYFRKPDNLLSQPSKCYHRLFGGRWYWWAHRPCGGLA